MNTTMDDGAERINHVRCSCARFSGISMRVAIFFNFAVGILLIVFGCMVQNPPKDYAPAMFVFLGSLNLFASLLGFWGSYNKKRLLMGFIACGGFSIVLQIALVLSLLFAFEPVSKAIVDPEKDPEKYKEVTHDLNIARWAAIGFLVVEIFTLVMAVVLRFVVKEDQPYSAFSEETNEARNTTLSSLAKDLGRMASKSKTMSEKAYDRIRDKMSAKYGASAASDASDWRSKTKFSWQQGNNV